MGQITHDHDVAVVGGGPAGCAAGIFCARAGLDTVVFDRGRSSLKRCAHLENYPGFPDGIDTETLYDLLHDHAETAGCEIVPDLVDSLDRPPEGSGFVLALEAGDSITARRVVAATRYDGSYMRGLGDDDAMFETVERDGEATEYFDRSYANTDGTTPVPDLYVASPSAESQQAITAAGRGARVAREVVTDARLDAGWWEAAAPTVDWTRYRDELDERSERAAWIEWFDERYADGAPVDPDSERYRRVRAAAVEEQRASYIGPEERDSRADIGQATVASHLDPEAVVAGSDERALLEEIDDETIAAYAETELTGVSTSGE